VAELVFGRRFDVRELITHQFPLEQTEDAIQLAAHPAAGSLKIIIVQDEGPGRWKRSRRLVV